jgi:hypothetical protein
MKLLRLNESIAYHLAACLVPGTTSRVASHDSVTRWSPITLLRMPNVTGKLSTLGAARSGVSNAGSRRREQPSIRGFSYAPCRAHRKNGGVREDPAIPARALLPTDQGRPHGNCIGASIHWTGRARGDEPARTSQWHPGQYEALTKSEPRHQPSRPETRPNQRLYVPLGSPPLVAVGSSSARAAHRSRAPKLDALRMALIAARVKMCAK